ncbi:uncharacterized protein LOC120133383 [Hibiscus syriacus]|uniref:uncharacterized protein LOC120133383 n=1 Tax=Hibiscus syriacus TaxID=106335 RepID=UPI001922353C|nr:uncharacterized protein LOC120133383 [Hibiscus syriacus]
MVNDVHDERRRLQCDDNDVLSTMMQQQQLVGGAATRQSSGGIRYREGNMQPWAIRVGPKPLGPNLPLLLSPFTPHFSSSYSHAPHLSATHFLQPPTSSSTLHLRVQGTCSLSPSHRHSLLNQVTRMLRLSESEENKLREFRSIVEALHGDEELATECLRSFGGRVFRSPTLFEDMVKCILLCNCQFSRTLSMAKALFELQFEIEHQIPGVKAEDYFIPKTPTGKELKRKLRVSKVSMRLESFL